MKDPLESSGPPAMMLSAVDSITWSAPRHDLSWFREQLRRYTYKPGWRFHVDGALFGWTAYLVGIMSVEDTYNPGRTVEVSATYPLYALDHNEDVFGRCVEALIAKMELHEAQEWLRRDGVIYNDPHKRS